MLRGAHATHVAVALEIRGTETVACGYLILTYPKFEPCVHTVLGSKSSIFTVDVALHDVCAKSAVLFVIFIDRIFRARKWYVSQ